MCLPQLSPSIGVLVFILTNLSFTTVMMSIRLNKSVLLNESTTLNEVSEFRSFS